MQTGRPDEPSKRNRRLSWEHNLPDYASMYDEYWSRPDRWQSHSFIDADPVVER